MSWHVLLEHALVPSHAILVVLLSSRAQHLAPTIIVWRIIVLLLAHTAFAAQERLAHTNNMGCCLVRDYYL